ncbi:hypothetical protein SAY87_016345 [Trapa incisa]|uniref:DUF868 family protein n=1 Tax=Trapa incisa TaxID=236973 RepID=A0AAN7L9V3_9MYRT|nr:hypothetical protein SAY87_016345 [Trapa incisa]
MLAKMVVERARSARPSVTMKDFPSCFGESGVQVADSSNSTSSPSSIIFPYNKHAQNFVTCVYKCKFRSSQSCLIAVTWTRSLMGGGLGVSIDDSTTHQPLCKVDIKPWLFSKRRGHRTTEVAVVSNSTTTSSSTVDIYWDLSNARFGQGPEPAEGFYLAVAIQRELVLLVGDMKKEACRKLNSEASICSSVLVVRRENIFGKKSYGTKAQFSDRGRTHDVAIECDTGELISDPCLVVRVDDKVVMQVRRLKWKFRGNGTITVDGMPVDVFWDVHNWLFGNSTGNAVFMFHSSMLAADDRKTASSDHHQSPADCTDPCDGGGGLRDSKSQETGADFSVIFYAWKND